MKAITALIAAGTLTVGYATYRHTVQHDEQQQMSDVLKVSASTPPRRTLPNLNTKPEEKPAEQQTNKESDKPVDQQPPAETPTEAQKKEEKKPFTFWGYLQSGQQLRPGIMFQVNSCHVGKTLVTCSMEAVSPQYDRTFYINAGTTITDHEGDQFAVQLNFTPLQLDRDAPVPFKLSFPVNKDVVEPITVRVNGQDPNAGPIQKASFVIAPKEQP